MPSLAARVRRWVGGGGGRVSAEAAAAMQAPTVRPEYGRLGVSGTQSSGGRFTGPSAEQNTALTGAQWFAEAALMRRTDSVVNGGVRALIDTQLTARWRFHTPDDGPPEALVARDYLNEAFGLQGARGYLHGGFEGLLRRILNYQVDGFRYLETLYCPDAGRVWVDFADCEPVAHAGFHFAPNGQLAYVEQLPYSTAEGSRAITPRIPANKLILFVEGQSGQNLEGLGRLRPAWFWFKLKQHAADQMAIGVERWGTPTPWVRVDYERLRAQGFDDSTIATMVDNAKQSAKAYLAHEAGYLVAPDGISFEVFGGSIGPNMLARDVVQECDRQILHALGLAFLLLGVNDTGSRAVGDVQASFFRRQCVNALDYVAAVIGGDEAPGQGIASRLLRWNFPGLDPAHYPRLVHEGLDPGPLLDFADKLQGLATAGVVTPTNDLEASFRDMLRLQPLAEEDQRTPAERTATSSPVGAAASLFSEGRRKRAG